MCAKYYCNNSRKLQLFNLHNDWLCPGVISYDPDLTPFPMSTRDPSVKTRGLRSLETRCQYFNNSPPTLYQETFNSAAQTLLSLVSVKIFYFEIFLQIFSCHLDQWVENEQFYLVYKCKSVARRLPFIVCFRSTFFGHSPTSRLGSSIKTFEQQI